MNAFSLVFFKPVFFLLLLLLNWGRPLSCS